ncbi:MAG: leukotriene A4 hydrolase C-terminal domain-containing protein, partial [Chitinophagales bacterium]|nr:leukotriene A4 hydrolase C-terminal domain-containing protein [Chitinophagales bacterium]
NKGAFFLRLLESKVGRAKWDIFINAYFTSNAFKVMTTEAFVEYLNANLIAPNKAAYADVDINAWIYGPGIPSNITKPVSVRFDLVDAQVKKFNEGAAANTLVTTNWTTHEWLRFIYQLPDNTSLEKMGALDKQFKFTGTGNCEIADAWYELAIKAKYTAAYAEMDEFLNSVGRRKFLMPLYKAMINTGQGELAKSIYAKARPGYHYVAQNSLDELVGTK